MQVRHCREAERQRRGGQGLQRGERQTTSRSAPAPSLQTSSLAALLVREVEELLTTSTRRRRRWGREHRAVALTPPAALRRSAARHRRRRRRRLCGSKTLDVVRRVGRDARDLLPREAALMSSRRVGEGGLGRVVDALEVRQGRVGRSGVDDARRGRRRTRRMCVETGRGEVGAGRRHGERWAVSASRTRLASRRGMCRAERGGGVVLRRAGRRRVAREGGRVRGRVRRGRGRRRGCLPAQRWPRGRAGGDDGRRRRARDGRRWRQSRTGKGELALSREARQARRRRRPVRPRPRSRLERLAERRAHERQGRR